MNKILKSACSAFAIGCATCIGFGVATPPNEVYGMQQNMDIELVSVENYSKDSEEFSNFLDLGMPGLDKIRTEEKNTPLSDDRKRRLYGMMFLYSYLLEKNEEIQATIHSLFSGVSIDQDKINKINEWYKKSLTKFINEGNEYRYFIKYNDKIIGLIYIDEDGEIDIFVHAGAKEKAGVKEGYSVATEAIKCILEKYFEKNRANGGIEMSFHPNNIAMLKTLERFKNEYSTDFNVTLSQSVECKEYNVEIVSDEGTKEIQLKCSLDEKSSYQKVSSTADAITAATINEGSYLGYHEVKNTTLTYPHYIVAYITKKSIK